MSAQITTSESVQQHMQDASARKWDVATCSVVGVAEGHTDGIHTAALSPDEAILATASYGPVVRLHVAATCAPLAVLQHAGPVSRLAFSPDSSLLAAALADSHQV